MDYNLAIISFCLSLPILILSQKYFLKKKYIDQIISRSSHSSIATRSGGISIFTTLFILSIIFYLDGKVLFDYSYLIPLSLLFMVGLYDDINSVDYKLKFIFQIITAKIIIDNGLIIDNLHGIFGIYELSRIVAQLLTIFIVVAIINSINFIDGIDGLAVSTVILFILSFEFFILEISPFINEDYLNSSNYYEQAIDYNQDNYVIYENLAISYDLSDRIDKALEMYDLVINNFKPNNGRVEFYKGLLLIRLGENELGCNYLRQSSNKNYTGINTKIRASEVFVGLCVNN